MNILLTATFKNGLFTNGLQQNIVFLSELLRDMGMNPMIAVNHEIQECVDPPKDILIMEEKEMCDYDYDYVCQTGFVISKKTIDKLKSKNPKLKNIHIHYGNRMLADIEQCKWDNRSVDPYKVDEVWISPHYEISTNYYKTYYKTDKVFILPYIWDSKYIDIHERIWNKTNKSCYYNPEKVKNIAVLEPNLNMTKNCIPSVFIAEEVFRANPDSFNRLNVYCSSVIREKIYFRSLMWNLDIQKKGKTAFLNRKTVSKVFANESSVVLSHQLMNALNYTYMESLYLNIPLVHNSEYIMDGGYYYPDYDTKEGARALKKALLNHDDNLDNYIKSSKKILDQYSPKNPEVIKQYKNLFK